jgi:hypothetical protein
VRFEEAKEVTRFQLHNMGNEAERYVGVMSFLPPFSHNLATGCLGYISGITHIQFVQVDHIVVGGNLP